MTWPTQFFNQQYYDLFMARTPEALSHDRDVLLHFLQPAQGDYLADFCCGQGDILEALVSQGLTGEGVELSPAYVAQAKARWPSGNVHCGDALTHTLSRKCDQAYNWFSSFGYLGKEQDVQLLNNMVHQTKDGGRVLIETSNSTFVRNNFLASIRYARQWHDTPFDVLRDSLLDEKAGVMHQKWTFQAEGICQVYDTVFQMYSTAEIIGLMHQAGLSKIEVFESPARGSLIATRGLSEQSARQILIGQKLLKGNAA